MSSKREGHFSIPVVNPAEIPSAGVAQAIQAKCHPACFACRSEEAGGLGLRFRDEADGVVAGEFDCDARYQSYPDRIHGGMVGMLIDAAMTHCLFHHGIAGVTGRLTIGFRAPIAIGQRATIRAWIDGKHPPLYRLRAEIVQGGEVKVQAEGKFMDRSEAPR